MPKSKLLVPRWLFLLFILDSACGSHEKLSRSLRSIIGTVKPEAMAPEAMAQNVSSEKQWVEVLKIASQNERKGFRDVRVDTGLVRGYLRKHADGEHFAYLGIPYAAPPTGRKRFMAPYPPKPWHDLFIANRTVRCPQHDGGNEDCLVVNVFTPAVYNTLLPVLVYIHGGSFIMGSGPTEGLGTFTQQQFIVVTLNYRLGVLGFLCLGIKEALGNAGLKDQTAALEWVQKNIKQFGGDPNQVTLYGLSAGGASVHFHVLSGASDGLFQKAIIESGSAVSVWSVDSEPINTAKLLTSILNPPVLIRNLEDLVRYLKHVPADALTKANYKLYLSLLGGTFGFVPCVENNYDANAFILEPPLTILDKRNYAAVPIVFIYAGLEGLFLRSSEYYELDYKNKMNKNFTAFIPADLNVDREPLAESITKMLQRQYFGSRGKVDEAHLIGYLNYFGDNLILHGLLKSAEIHSAANKPVYLMEFAYKSERGIYEKFYEYINTAGHGDLSKNLISTTPLTSRSDKLAVQRLSRLIANFVRFGNPTPMPTSILPVKWPPVSPGNLMFLYLDQEFSIQQYSNSRKRLWDELYSLYRKPVKPVNPFIFI